MYYKPVKDLRNIDLIFPFKDDVQNYLTKVFINSVFNKNIFINTIILKLNLKNNNNFLKNQ